MNFRDMISHATRSIAFYLEHYSDCADCGDYWGQRNARRGIINCLHVIRLAKAHGGIS